MPLDIEKFYFIKPILDEALRSKCPAGTKFFLVICEPPDEPPPDLGSPTYIVTDIHSNMGLQVLLSGILDKLREASLHMMPEDTVRH